MRRPSLPDQPRSGCGVVLMSQVVSNWVVSGPSAVEARLVRSISSVMWCGGASMVGARGFLIAYNVNLATQEAAVARAIARTIRESSGGLRFVKAMGVFLPSRGCAQVSMNLTDFAQTPLDRLYEAVRQEAARLGTEVASSQVIGFIPRRAFEMASEFFERAENFDESRILETRIGQLLQLK